MKLLLLPILLIMTSCSLAPFAPSTSGRSAGQGNIIASVGNTNSTYHIKFGLGVTPELDAGFDMEFGTISTSAIFFKYSFLNNEVGPSVAAEFGYGSTETTKFYYGGVVGSLAFSEQFELFLNTRINSVSTDETDIEKDKFNGNVKITEYDVNYLQLTLGFNVFFNESAGISLYNTYFRGNDIETLEDATFGATLLFKF